MQLLVLQVLLYFNMNARQGWLEEVHCVYEQMRMHRKPYDIFINDLEIVVFPDVFSPAYFTDSAWFARIIPPIIGRKSLLEIGTGTGIIALSAALNGATVVATDINPQAVANAQENLKHYNVTVPVLWGNVYSPLCPEDRFDFIFWNHPFNRAEEPVEELLMRAGFDYRYQGLEEYIQSAHKHLNKNGILLLGTGNFADVDEIKRIASKNQYSLVLMRSKKMPLTGDSIVPNEYRIYEFQRR